MSQKRIERKKIIRHLSVHGNCVGFELTPRLMKHWWNRLNVAVFDNKLSSNVSLKAVQMFYREQQCWGLCQDGGDFCIIKIDSLCLPDRLGKAGFLTVLVHEMVHQWQLETYGKMTHGATFLPWERKIKRTIGLSLTMSIAEDEIWLDLN